MKVIVPLAEGFEEIEFNAIVDILRRAGIAVTVAGLTEGVIEGGHGIRVISDTSIDKINAAEFDAIALPGGAPGYVNLGKDARVLKLVEAMHQAGKYVTAICGAPTVLAKAGILKGRQVTCHPNVREMLAGARCVNERVVVDGRIITSQGPGTAIEFALKLAEALAGKDVAAKVSEAALVKR
ncbi:DJ-1 family glyoxalase III [Chloroflexota bacterium]